MRSWRNFCLSLFSLLIFAAFGFAQQTNVQQDDNTDTAVQRERSEARAEALQEQQQDPDAKAGDTGEIQDDATARIDWLVHGAGVQTDDSKKNLLHQRGNGRHGGHGKRGIHGADTSTFGANTDLGSLTFSAPGADLQQAGSSSSDPTWVPIGPADADYEQNGAFNGTVRDSGRARKILPHPTDANTMYFLNSGGGLWVTNNFLSDPPSWRPLTDNLPTTGGGSVAFGRTPNVLYLGLGDPFDVIQVGGAMLKSVDGGQTWTNFVELGTAQSVRDIQVDTSGPNDIVLVTTDIGLFRSIDGGVTYNQILGGTGELFRNKSMWHMVRSSAGYLVEAQSCLVIPAINCGATANGGPQPGTVYISTDIGATWAAVPNTGNVLTGIGRATLAVAQPGDTVVYAIAATASDNAQNDLFRSNDGGLNWIKLNITAKAPLNANANNTNMNLLHAQAYYNQLILVDPRDANRNTVYLGGDLSSAKTTDGGNSWTLISDWLYGGRGPSYAHADFHTATFANLNGTATLLFGSDGGMFVSTDDGANWSSNKNKGLESFLFYTVMGTPRFPNIYIAGAQDNGTRVRKGKSRTFNQSLGGDGLGVGWSQANGSFSIGTAAGSNGYRLNLAGKVPDRIEDYVSFTFYAASEALFGVPVETPPPSVDPTGSIFYTFSTLRVQRFDAKAFTLTQLGVMGANGLPATGRSFRGDPHNIAVSADLNHVAVNANAGNLEITSNALNAGTANPVTWTERSLTALVPGWVGFNSSVIWADNQTLYVTSEAPTANAARIAKSTNGGASFVRADSGIPDGRVNRIIVDPRDATHNTLYAASDLGVFKSTDAANSWQPYGNGLPNVRVSDIYMPPDGSALIGATYGRGLWELPSLTYAASTLTDDGISCDEDGVLDAGETGHLGITLHNDGNGTFNSITATITSNNPNVTFPNGNTISFPAAGPGADSTSSIAVKLDGSATGIQSVTFTIAFTDGSLNLPSAVTAQSSFRINYDEIPNGSANDNIEASNTAWTVTGTPTAPPNVFNWQRLEVSPTEHHWLETNSNATADQSLISPVLHVGNDPFTFSFDFRYFLSGGDGMVIEASTDNGNTWTDIGQFATPTYGTTPITTSTGLLNGQVVASNNPLAGRRAYTGLLASYPGYTTVTVNLGNQFAGQDVRIRFRVGTDQIGFANAMEIKNIRTTGLTNTPFTAVIPHRGVCPTTISLSSSENPSTYGHTVTFLASVSGGVSTPTGTVSFKDSGTSIGSGSVNNSGQASFSISSLSAGSHQITAVYSGDASHASSVSDALAQVVNPAPLTITADNKSRLLDSPNPPLTATYSGFVLGEGPGVLVGTLSCTTTALTNSPAGDYPITCSGQSSTNYSITYVPGTLSVLFASAGSCLGEPGHTILGPIAANGTSVFNGGRTVPAKFRVCDANGVSIGTPGTVSSFNIVQVITGTSSDVNLSVDSTTPDTAFRWDPTAQEWIFNISTKGLAAGATYVFRIGLSDGSNITFQFGLR